MVTELTTTTAAGRTAATPSAVALLQGKVSVDRPVGHRADLGGDGLHHAEKGCDQERRPGPVGGGSSPRPLPRYQRLSGRCPTEPK